MICRIRNCESALACTAAKKCLYRSSADEAREVIAQERRAQVEGAVSKRFPIPRFSPEVAQLRPTVLPVGSQERKDTPVVRGFIDYFPAAVAEVARLSKAGNDKHNPGEELHHARGKSGDHADCILRHLIERGTVDTDGFLHDVKVAWRAMAMLQEALEARGALKAPAAR